MCKVDAVGRLREVVALLGRGHVIAEAKRKQTEQTTLTLGPYRFGLSFIPACLRFVELHELDTTTTTVLFY